MPTLTSSSVLAIGAAIPAVETVTLDVLGAPTSETGKGRLVHPTLGTLDYSHKPNSWTNIDGDVIAPPVWASSKTLKGSSNTLWRGDLRDVEVVERWDGGSGGLKMRIEMLRMLIQFWTNPPDPATSWVIWSPSYTSPLSFKVAITSLQVGGQGVTLDFVAHKGWATGDIELRMKIIGRV